MNKKLSWLSFYFAFLMFAVAALWRWPFLLVFALIVAAIVKHRHLPLKHESRWFLLTLIMGFLAEAFLVNISHAWVYARPQLAGVPIWMPLLWANLSSIVVSAYEEVGRK